MKKIIIIILLLMHSQIILSQESPRSEIVSINGKNIYYEVHGQGKPLLLLHGYSLSSKAWKPYVTDFANEYEVYLIDLPGHGQSDAFREDLSIKNVAKDLNALIGYLKLDEVQAIGFSFGGDVLYQLALLNPNLIKSMITIGAVGTWDVNDFEKYLEAFTFENRQSLPWLSTHHTDDDKVRALMDQFKNYTIVLSDEELQAIQPEVLIMVGDDDEGMDLTEVARVKKNLPNSDLWVLPNVAHSAHEGETKEEFLVKAKVFLNKD